MSWGGASLSSGGGAERSRLVRGLRHGSELHNNLLEGVAASAATPCGTTTSNSAALNAARIFLSLSARPCCRSRGGGPLLFFLRDRDHISDETRVRVVGLVRTSPIPSMSDLDPHADLKKNVGYMQKLISAPSAVPRRVEGPS